MIKEFLTNIMKYKFILKSFKKEVFLLSLLNILIILLAIISPAFVAKIVTFVINKKYSLVIYVILALAGIKALHILVSLIDARVFLIFRKKLVIKLKELIAVYVSQINLSEFNSNSKGKFIQRLNNDPQDITRSMFEMKRHIVVFATNIGSIIYIFHLDYISGIIYFLTLISIIGFRMIGINKKYKYLKINALNREKNSSFLIDTYNGIKDVKEFDLNDSVIKSFNHKTKIIEQLQFKADFRFEIFNILSRIVEWTGTAIFILVGVYSVSINRLSLDSFVTIFMYRNIVFSFVLCLSSFIDQLSIFNLASQRVFEVIDTNKEKTDSHIFKDNCKGIIEFKNVSFAYDKAPVLKNCSFKIDGNGLYSLVGKSGVGKTTICNLITRLYIPDKGNIYIDGIDMKDYSERYIRNNISIVSQNYYLFNMSIKDNLLLIKPSLSDEEIIKVCKRVGLHDDIMNLSDKYDTIVSDGGSNLSGGQRKRLAIARAILLDNKIIIFDEATTSLDTDLENTIFSLAEDLSKNHVVIFISHNKRLIDKIKNNFVVKKGKVALNRKIK